MTKWMWLIMEKIAFLHMNDIHSHFEMLPDLYRQMMERKIALEKQGYEVIIVDIGDLCDRSHPLTEATLGQVNAELLNAFQVQYFTIGNNEGLGLQKQTLKHLYDHVQGECVLGNLYDHKKLAKFAKKCAIYETNSGTKIGIIGLTAPYPMSYGPLGWEIIDPLLSLQDIYQSYQHKADQFVLLSHLGYEVDVNIAKQAPWLAAIFGGHTHHLLPSGEIINNVLLAAAGKHGKYFGEVLLNEQIAQVYPVSADTSLEQKLQLQGQKKLAEVQYGIVTHPLSKTEFTKMILDKLTVKFECDLGILNDGLCVKDVPKGDLTKATLHELFPHPMHLLKVRLSGKELKRLLFEIDKNRNFLKKFALRGFGFRGEVFGQVLFSEQFDLEEINEQKEYRILTVDHYEFIPFFPTIAYAGNNQIYMEKFLREQIAEIIQDESFEGVIKHG